MYSLRPLTIASVLLLLLAAGTIHGAALLATSTSTAPVMVVTPEPAAESPPTESPPTNTATTSVVPAARAEKTGRAYHKSDDEYPTGYSAPEAHLYPAGHSAEGGHTAYGDADEISGPDHHGNHYADHGLYGHHAPPAILVNAAYDPSAFQNFVPQFYETYAGGKHHHLPHDLTYAVPVWPGTQPGAALTVHDYAVHHGGGIDHVTTDATTTTSTTTTTAAPPATTALGVGLAVVSQVLPRSMAVLLMRSVGFLLNSLGVLLFGGAVTTAVCALTPLCTITFALGLRQAAATGLKQVLGEPMSATVGGLVESSSGGSLALNETGISGTGARIARAAQMVGRAIEKYQRIQAEADAVAATTDAAAETAEGKSAGV